MGQVVWGLEIHTFGLNIIVALVGDGCSADGQFLLVKWNCLKTKTKIIKKNTEQ